MIPAATAVAAHAHEAGGAQHREMLRDGGLRQRQALDQIPATGGVTGGKRLEDFQTGRMAERLEHVGKVDIRRGAATGGGAGPARAGRFRAFSGACGRTGAGQETLSSQIADEWVLGPARA